VYFVLYTWLNTAEMAVLSVFWQKNGLGLLGVKKVYIIKFSTSIAFKTIFDKNSLQYGK